MTFKPGITASEFGRSPDGRVVRAYTITNSNGLSTKLSELGTGILELHVPDARGEFCDVVLGFDDLAGYLVNAPYFAATVGRVANRIANARFTLDGREYVLAANNGSHHLHGGLVGFDRKLWQSELVDDRHVRFSYVSFDGEEGYPGNLDVTVTIGLTDANELSIDYVAATDKPTLINLTNHSYFNLSGAKDVLDHELTIFASQYTRTNTASLPTGEIVPVAGTPLDFRAPRRIGSRLAELAAPEAGYDTNFVVERQGPGLVPAARLANPRSGRVMEVLTTQPGVQLYTANFFDGALKGKRGAAYAKHAGVCLETQHFADAIHHPHFPSVVLRPGETYRHTTIYKFSIQQLT